MQYEFAKETVKELIRRNDREVNKDNITSMLEDAVMHFDNYKLGKCKTAQHSNGISELLREFAVKDQRGANFNCRKYSALNKIIVTKAVLFCKEHWQHKIIAIAKLRSKD